jgi:hypothetical protein
MNLISFANTQILRFLLNIGVLLVVVNSANASCNNERDWLDVPTKGVKTFIGYKQDQPGNFDTEDIVQSPSYQNFPAPLPLEMFGKEGSGSLSAVGASSISFYEPDGKGNWRICRRDDFWPQRTGGDGGDSWKKIIKKYAAGSALLSQVVATQRPLFATMFFYDARGRIARIETGDYETPERPVVVEICRRYDERDRLTLLLKPISTQSCANDPPDVRDKWLHFRFGEYEGEEVVLRKEMHYGSKTGEWFKDFHNFRVGSAPNSPHGVANAKSEKGLTIIYGFNIGKLDDNAANTVVNEFGQVSVAGYFFTQPPVPLDVLEHPELIYKYERRRQTYIEGQLGKLFELFKPNEHISRHRYYFLGRMLRNEQLDANGKVTRVITVDDYRQERPGPHPDVDDKLLTDKAPRLIGHQIYHRVYDIDAKGKPKLVAVSWNRKVRLNPLKKTNMDFADMAYGTPDGKKRWKTAAEFEKAFGFSADAVEVFPDEANGNESEQM